MIRKLRWKLVVILAVVIGTSAFAWLPPVAEQLGLRVPGFFTQKRLLLGLDLKGGVQFVLRVNADEVLGRAGADESGAVTRHEIVAQAKEAIDRRINALGVTEPVIAVQGDRGDEILVQLPGFTDVERARGIIGSTARLEWRLLEDGSPAAAAVTGGDIRRAWVTRDDLGQPAVGFSLTPDGARRFAELTSANIGRQVAIVLDDEVQSAPVIETAITRGEGILRGGDPLTLIDESLADLVTSLTTGKLKFQLTELSAIPRAAVVVEERYSQVFKLDHVRPSVVADGIAECQIRFPTVPIVFCETRKLAQEWIYRFLAAARVGAVVDVGCPAGRVGVVDCGGGVAGAGIAVGPILGGWATTEASWRIVFVGERRSE